MTRFFNSLNIGRAFKIGVVALMLLTLNSTSFAKKKKKELTKTEKAAQTITSIPEVRKGDSKIKSPVVPAGYKLELKGSATPQIISTKGKITTPIAESDVQLYYLLTDTKSNETAEVSLVTKVPGEFTQAENANSCPPVIPKLREWIGQSGQLKISNRIVLSKKFANKLTECSELLANDMNFFFGKKPKVTKGKAKKGDIFITLKCSDKSLGEEGYRMIISDKIELMATNVEGIKLGTKTILQLMNIYGDNIPKGIIRDYPKYKRRGFMLDVARKFFKLQFLKDYVRIMSYYKMNEFHIHLNDNGFKQFHNNDWSKTYAAFRLESETYPGLTAKDGSYTKKEFTALQKMGMKYGVNIIPEIDIPAHSLAFTQYRPSIGSEEYGIDHLDIKKKETYDFCDKLFAEYLEGDNPVFIGPDVHIGTDEYSKKEAEAFRKFTDHYLELVQGYGKRARLWGALTHAKGKTPVRSKGVIMNAWYNGYAQPRDMIDQGYELISTPDRYLYIVPAAGYYYDYLNLDYLYKKWEPVNVGGEDFPMGHPGVTGGSFAVWNDHCGNGISEKDVHHRAYPALQILAQKMWTGTDTTYNLKKFKRYADKLVEAPYVNVMGKVKSKSYKVLDYKFEKSPKKDYSKNSYNIDDAKNSKYSSGIGYKFNKNSVITTPIEEIGYSYVVDFEVTFSSENQTEAVLFSSANAEVVVTVADNKATLGFKRDGYYYTFKTKLDCNKKLSLSVLGDNKGTMLFVDGKKVEDLRGLVEEHKRENGAINKMYIQQTLVFPLKHIGDANKSFVGTIHSVKVVNKLR